MKALPRVKQRIHRVHDGVERMAHATGHIMHEKSFWAIAAILAGLTILMSLLVIYGNGNGPHNYISPLPYGSYF